MYKTAYLNSKEHALYSGSYGSFSKTDYMLGHNTNLNKSRKAEMIPRILYDRYAIKLKTGTKQSSSQYIDS